MTISYDPYFQCLKKDLIEMSNSGPILSYVLELHEIHNPEPIELIFPGWVDITSGTEGPKHDPYSVSTYTYYREDTDSSCTLHVGSLSGVKFFAGDQEIKFVSEEAAINAFHVFCGLTLDQLDQYDSENYVEDPMGSPSMYI